MPLPADITPPPPRPAPPSPTANCEHIIGDPILAIDPTQLERDFNCHRPMRRGDLNIHPGIGGSLHAVLADLQLIWQHALHQLLGRPVSAGHYRAVLIIPDCYNRWYLRELMQLLLQRLQFRAAFLVQDHVCATFGAGLPFACVVDCGDEKTSVSCVEDGISHPATRVRLGYGGADVALVHRWLLRKCGWKRGGAEAGAGAQRPRDAMLVRRAKEEWCHVDADRCGVQERRWRVEAVGEEEVAEEWLVMCGDEAMVAPLALFETGLLAVTRRAQEAKGQNAGKGEWPEQQVQEVWVQKVAAQQPDAEDCFDAEYLKETGRKYTREQLDQSAMPLLLDTSATSTTAAPATAAQPQHATADTATTKPTAPSGGCRKRRQSSELLIDAIDAMEPGNGNGNGLSSHPSDHPSGSAKAAKTSSAADAANGHGQDTNSASASSANDFRLPNGQIMAVDAAIQRSIEQCGSDEVRRKMYANVLLVGGGMRFDGMAKWLQARLAALAPKLGVAGNGGSGGGGGGDGGGGGAEAATAAATANGGGGVTVAVAMGGKDGDAQTTVWRGAAIMAGLESAPELFIEAAEWRRGGVRVLRERAPFMW